MRNKEQAADSPQPVFFCRVKIYPNAIFWLIYSFVTNNDIKDYNNDIEETIAQKYN